MIAALTNALVPIFAGLLLGYLAGRWKFVDNQNVRTLITFVMSMAVPCSLFSASLICTYLAGLFTMAGWMVLLSHMA
ncbi:MAG: AEC family transporter [Chthoniobacterales bacterium]